MALHGTFATLAYNAHTLFLFTKGDIHTTFLPIIILGLVAAPVYSVFAVFHSALWLWLHLLQCDVANQIYGLAEDVLNKGYRPLPAGRITLQSATTLRWSLFPLCTLVSALYSRQILCASTLFSLLTFVYNELHIDAGGWLVRNAVNGAAFAALESGTILLAGQDRTRLDPAAVRAVLYSAAVITTTIHVQDFRDVVGDREAGRRTLPLVSEPLARLSVAATVLPWSIALARAWGLDGIPAMIFVVLGGAVVTRFLLYRTVPEDKTSYKIYNIWLTVANLLVGYWRYKSSSIF